MEKSVRKDYFLLMVLCLILSALCFSGKALPPPLSVIYGVMLFLIGIGTLWMLVKERLRRRKGKGRLSRIFLGLFELLIVGLACLAVAVFLLSINPPGIVIVGALSLLVFFALFTFLGIMNIVGEREVKPEKTEQQGDSGRWWWPVRLFMFIGPILYGVSATIIQRPFVKKRAWQGGITMAKKNSKVLLVVIIILLVAACTFAIPFGFLIGVAVDNLTFSAVPVAIFLLMLGVLVVLLRATFRRMRPPGTRPAAAV